MLTVPNVQDGRGGEAASRCALTGWQERHGMLRSFRREMRAHPRLSMGFGLFWTWVWLVFQTTFFQPRRFSRRSTFRCWMGRAAVGVRLYVFGVGRAAEGEEGLCRKGDGTALPCRPPCRSA
mgnify:CR=1 FL=1